MPGGDGILEKDGKRFSRDDADLCKLAGTAADRDRASGPASQVGIDVKVSVGNSSEDRARHQDGTLEMAGLTALFDRARPRRDAAPGLRSGGSDWGAMGWANKEMQAIVDQLAATSDPDAARRCRSGPSRSCRSELPSIPVTWSELAIVSTSASPGSRSTPRGELRSRLHPLGGIDETPLLARLVQAGLVVLVVGVLCFVLMRVLPGDPAMRIAAGRYGPDAKTAEAAEQVRRELGLDQPAGQFADWIGQLARLDLGRSLVTGAADRRGAAVQLGYSLWLAASALVLSLLLGPPIGVVAGLRPQGWVNRLVGWPARSSFAPAALRARAGADAGLRDLAGLAAAGRLRHLARDRAAGADAGARPRGACRAG